MNSNLDDRRVPDPHPGSEPEVLLHDASARGWRRFAPVVEILVARRTEEVVPTLIRVQEGVRAGLFAAGFLSYEAAPAFDPALRVREPAAHPLVWFVLARKAEPCAPPAASDGAAPRLIWRSEWSPAEHLDRIGRIREAIARGETYQVNATFRMRATCPGDPAALFASLVARQQGAYSGWIRTPEFALLSASPELFFSREGDLVTCRPMKGTAPRSPDPEQDRATAERLGADAKNRAENVMIVDMVRNDLGRVARPGSVRVERLFDVEAYPNVWQMTSTVSASTDADFPELLRALFPSASITGAPKPRTMRIIRDLETSPRGPYTGTLGFLEPNGHAQFNVLIRSLWLDRAGGQAEFGVGGGIVWDSNPRDEYQECLRKASILLHPGPVFSLLETLRWNPGSGYSLLERHLARLARSAAALGFCCEPERIREQLQLEEPSDGGPAKVRLLLDFGGGCLIESEPLAPEPEAPRRLRLAVSPVSSGDLFLRHKTTRRGVYEAARAGGGDCDDVILWNERGEITETTTDNLVLELGGELLTPALEAGLLPGTCREDLLERGLLSEAELLTGDLLRADAIYTINSVRGMRKAILAETAARDG